VKYTGIAIVELLMGGGLLYFWYAFFREVHEPAGKPEGFFLHERAFVWPDVTLALLLFVSAGLLLSGNPLGERTSLVAGGMCLFLGIIDFAYDAQNHMLSAGAEGRAENLFIDSVALGMGLLLCLAFLF
jgi:hypothetical protein